MNIFNDLYNWREERRLNRATLRHDLIYINILEEVLEGIAPSMRKQDVRVVASLIFRKYADEEVYEHDIIDSLFDIGIYSINGIREMGYEPELVYKEGFKEIDSRVGEWSDIEGKWVKDTSEYAKSKWYKADFKKCEIENIKQTTTKTK